MAENNGNGTVPRWMMRAVGMVLLALMTIWLGWLWTDRNQIVEIVNHHSIDIATVKAQQIYSTEQRMEMRSQLNEIENTVHRMERQQQYIYQQMRVFNPNMRPLRDRDTSNDNESPLEDNQDC